MATVTPTTDARRSRTGSKRPRKYSVRRSGPYQSLLSRLQSMDFGVGRERRCLGLTSCDRGEGVTTVASNLAVYTAQNIEARILVVDANLAHPFLHKAFKLEATPGLAHAIDGTVAPEETIQPCGIENLFIVASGIDKGLGRFNLPPFEVERVFESYRSDFDLIIVDLPAVSVPTDLNLLTSQLDGVLVVLAAEGVSAEVADRRLRPLAEGGAGLMGVVFNKRRRHLPQWIDGM